MKRSIALSLLFVMPLFARAEAPRRVQLVNDEISYKASTPSDQQHVIVDSLPNVSVQPVAGTTTTVRSLADCRGSGQTIVDAVLSNLTSGSTAYTVTAGKTLYVKNINISAVNTGAAGYIRIQDGAAIKVPVSIAAAGIGAMLAATSAQISSISYPQGKPFTTSVNMTIAAGTITYSLEINGCEE